MKNIVLIFVLFFCIHSLSAQTNSQKVNESVVKNVVLINKNPWEVLMTRNGDILAKIKGIPDYLKGVEAESSSDPVVERKQADKVVQPVVDVVVSGVEKKEKNATQFNIPENEVDFSDASQEVTFNLGSALLSSNQIKILDNITSRLVSDRTLKFNIFGFNSEPEYRFYILSKRRMDAVLSYLKVKGVDIDNQIIVNSSVKGHNNKIVFARVR